MDDLTIMSLCSGGGGLDLGVEFALGHARPVCYVEWEAGAVAYLADCMATGLLAQAPLWTNLATFDGHPWRGVVDILTAGYPCQPFSVAGNRRGSEDPRHLWPHVHRVIGECAPGIVFLENVPGHLSLGFPQVASGLESLGYEVAAGTFKARDIGATSERSRLFILALAHADAERLASRGPDQPGLERPILDGPGDDSADLDEGIPLFPPPPEDFGAWERILTTHGHLSPAQPKVRLLADGLATERVRTLKLAGNGVCPLQAAYALCSLWAVLRAAYK